MRIWQMLMGGEDSHVLGVATASSSPWAMSSSPTGDAYLVHDKSPSGVAFTRLDAGWVESNALSVAVLGGTNIRRGYSMDRRGNDIYLASGYYAGETGSDSITLLKTNALTGTAFQTRITKTSSPFPISPCRGVAIGSNFSAFAFFGASGDPSWLVKLNESGVVQFHYSTAIKFGYGNGSGNEVICALTDDSLVGVFASGGTAYSSVCKITHSGAATESWTYKISGDLHMLTAVCSDGAGGFLACGKNTSTNQGFVCRITAGATITWFKKVTVGDFRRVHLDATNSRAVAVGNGIVVSLALADGAFVWGRYGGSFQGVFSAISPSGLVVGDGTFVKFPLADGGGAGTYPIVGTIQKMLSSHVASDSVTFVGAGSIGLTAATGTTVTTETYTTSTAAPTWSWTIST